MYLGIFDAGGCVGLGFGGGVVPIFLSDRGVTRRAMPKLRIILSANTVAEPAQQLFLSFSF